MTPEQIDIAFEKFYGESPLVAIEDRYLTKDRVKLAMKVSYMAGWALLAEEMKKHL